MNSQVRGALLLCFGVFDPPLAPLKTYFYEKAQNMLKFGNFQKYRFFFGGGVQSQRGGFGLEPSKMSLYMIIYFLEGWRPKNATFQKFLHLENVISKLFGGPGGSPSEKFCQKWF